MRIVMVMVLEVDTPQTVKLIQCSDVFQLAFPDECIHHLMEFLDFAFRLPAPYRRMRDRDTKLCQRQLQLLCDVLRTVIKVASVKCSCTKQHGPEGIFYNLFLLRGVKLRGNDKPRMIVYRRRQVGLDLGSAFSDWKQWPILDVSLDQHHTVWLAEALRGALPCILVGPQML